MKTRNFPNAVKLIFSFFIAALIIYFSNSCTDETYTSSSRSESRTYEYTQRKYERNNDTEKTRETTTSSTERSYTGNNYSSGSRTDKKETEDPYGAGDYVHPDDFYYDHYDDFYDYEDAEDYWEDYN